MSKVIAIGETIYDIIFLENRPVAGSPGGAMLNSAVSLGRTGLDVQLVSEMGDDALGKIITGFLARNGVITEYITAYPDMKTPVSIAVLDEQMNASYNFYKEYPADRLTGPLPEAGAGDVVLFGSFYSLDAAIRQKLVPWLRKTRNNGAIVLYDPNIRKNHLPEIRNLMESLADNFAMADIVRGSDEDFENLYGSSEPDEVYRQVFPDKNGVLVLTRNRRGVDLVLPEYVRHDEVPLIQVASTIGAGDAFNAGLLFGLRPFLHTFSRPVEITPEDWHEIVRTGITFATNTCQSYENFISTELAEIFRKIVEISKHGS